VTGGRERIATLAIGYADGLPWSLSAGGEAIVLGRRVPIRGAVCMDVTAVDVSGVPEARVGTVATLLGRDGDETITLEDLARSDRTIEYEILTGFGRRLPRRYVDGRTEPEDGWASETR
jgi:alanine racemase